MRWVFRVLPWREAWSAFSHNPADTDFHASLSPERVHTRVGGSVGFHGTRDMGHAVGGRHSLSWHTERAAWPAWTGRSCVRHADVTGVTPASPSAVAALGCGLSPLLLPRPGSSVSTNQILTLIAVI